MRKITASPLRVFLVLLALLGSSAQLLACSDSPSDVVEDLGEFAKRRRLVQFRRSFSTAARKSLKRQFAEDGLTAAEGWRDLMIGYMGRDRKAPEVVGEELLGESNATVKVSKLVKAPRGSKEPNQVIVQTLQMVKEDDEWRLALGPLVYEMNEEEPEEGEEEPEKPLEEEEPSFELEEKKEAEPVEDINLDDF